MSSHFRAILIWNLQLHYSSLQALRAYVLAFDSELQSQGFRFEGLALSITSSCILEFCMVQSGAPNLPAKIGWSPGRGIRWL